MENIKISKDECSYKACFFAVRHENKDDLVTSLLKYDIGKYLIAMETADDSHHATNGQHFHILVQMSAENYHTWSQYIKRKYKLRGQSRDGNARQYGTLREIRDLEKLATYMCKDKNVISNMAQKDLDRWANASFKKDFKQIHYKNLMRYLQDRDKTKTNFDGSTEIGDGPTDIGLAIINYYRTNCKDMTLNPTTVKMYVYKYLLYYSSMEDYSIYIHMFPQEYR